VQQQQRHRLTPGRRIRPSIISSTRTRCSSLGWSMGIVMGGECHGRVLMGDQPSRDSCASSKVKALTRGAKTRLARSGFD